PLRPCLEQRIVELDLHEHAFEWAAGHAIYAREQLCRPYRLGVPARATRQRADPLMYSSRCNPTRDRRRQYLRSEPAICWRVQSMSVWGHSGRIDTPATFAPCPLRSNRVRGSASQRNDAACQSRPSALKQKAPLFATSSASPNARDFAERDVMEYLAPFAVQ